MRTKFFCTNFLNTTRGPGHPGKIPGTSRIPLFETQGRQSFEGGHEVFGHHPFAWKTPTPPGALRTQKLNLCALFSCLRLAASTFSKRRRCHHSGGTLAGPTRSSEGGPIRHNGPGTRKRENCLRRRDQETLHPIHKLSSSYAWP